MYRDLRNLKISPATHQLLKVQAAKQSVPVAEYADMLLCHALANEPDLEELRKAFHNFADTAARTPTEDGKLE